MSVPNIYAEKKGNVSVRGKFTKYWITSYPMRQFLNLLSKIKIPARAFHIVLPIASALYTVLNEIWNRPINSGYILAIVILGFSLILEHIKSLQDEKSLFKDRRNAFKLLDNNGSTAKLYSRIIKLEITLNTNVVSKLPLTKQQRLGYVEKKLTKICQRLVNNIDLSYRKKMDLGASIFLFGMNEEEKEYEPFKFCHKRKKNELHYGSINPAYICGAKYPISENTDFLDIFNSVEQKLEKKYFCCNDVSQKDSFRDSNFRYLHGESEHYVYKKGMEFKANYLGLITVPIYDINKELVNKNDIIGFLSVDSTKAHIFTKAERCHIQIVASLLYGVCAKI